MIAELIERLEKATGPDRGLDNEIGVLAGVLREALTPEELDIHESWPVRHQYLPHYTSSIDAAMTLVPPGQGWHVLLTDQGKAAAFVGRGGYVKGATPAIALCIVALKAKAVLPSTDQSS